MSMTTRSSTSVKPDSSLGHPLTELEDHSVPPWTFLFRQSPETASQSGVCCDPAAARLTRNSSPVALRPRLATGLPLCARALALYGSLIGPWWWTL